MLPRVAHRSFAGQRDSRRSRVWVYRVMSTIRWWCSAVIFVCALMLVAFSVTPSHLPAAEQGVRVLMILAIGLLAAALAHTTRAG